MSKLICSSAISGAQKIYEKAKEMVQSAIAAKGEDYPLVFPDTAYYLPVIYSMTGFKVEKLSDTQYVLDQIDKLIAKVPDDDSWLPYLGDTLDSGMAALFAFEIIEACKYIIGPNPTDGIWLGAADDVIIRERGVEFVDGSAPGFAAIVGAAPDKETAVKIARELQEKNLYIFMAGEANGTSFSEQLVEAGVEIGWETRLVPFGRDISAAVYALGFASRAALSFGGVKSGDYKGNLLYNKNRVFAFVIALGEVTEEDYAAAAGAINYGFPVIANTDIPEILPTGICTYEHVVSNVPCDTIVERALEIRGCKIKVTKIPIPVSYGAAFEGERIRKEQVYVEFGGNRKLKDGSIAQGFEYVTTKELDQIQDHKIEVIGPEVDDVEPGTALPIAIWVEVAGRKMQPDFESILERQIHNMINSAEGIWHMGQRDINWMRISIAAKEKGFKIAHFGEILYAKLLNDYPAIVDKVQVTIYTDKEKVAELIEEARKVYKERNERVEALTDETVDTFYSCLLCQSFAPNHVCVITPERLGLCGAYNWLDGKAAYEIDPTGPNQPIEKGETLDPIRGCWKNVNDYVYANSKKSLSDFSAYSMIENPMTSCGCFEAIVSVVPECNGVAIVSRDYAGDTPVGMKFSTLAGVAGGGQQTPGTIGIGKVYASSKKFISAEGGHKRIIWMPKQLKDDLKDELGKIGERLGIENYADTICDESIAIEASDIRVWLEKTNHPALDMWDIMEPSPEAQKWDEEHSSVDIKTDVKTEAKASVVVNNIEAETEVTKSEEIEILEPMKTVEKVSAIPENSPLAPVASILETVSKIGLPDSTSAKTPEEQMTALQVSTAMNLLTAGAQMLLMYSGALGVTPGTMTTGIPVSTPIVKDEVAKLEIVPKKEVASAIITMPSKYEAVLEPATVPIKEVVIGGSGSRTSSVKLGGADVYPFRHFEGNVGFKPVIGMEVFDWVNPKLAPSLIDAYGEMINNPVDMAKYCINEIGAEMISIRFDGAHPDNLDKSPEDCVKLTDQILTSVGVPVMVNGPGHYDKINEVMKAVANEFKGENLLLSWAETDNFKTLAAVAMSNDHCLVAQTPIDVNMAKQLNILMTNLGLNSNKILIDAMTSAIGYGIEYTYSVMERIIGAAYAGDEMLSMPIIVTPGYEVAKIKESKAASSDFPLWGDDKRGELLEISTTMALLNSGASLAIMYYPKAARTVIDKIDEMMKQ